ncbi:MAG: polyribonucleotide nucleotidyltransferase [Deltaproteobacteria bacterium]|nr:polyribonucleotide nucleotidyltransferase [Deltaproteobacteria bacterium]MBI4197311.1 polyribonucleotide nucleotidyltransferase [Deltaproteobacteria bacterium]
MTLCREVNLGGKRIIIETGKLARQAGGAVTVRCDDTIVLVTAVMSKKPREGVDFLPLSCDYIEKTFAAGKIPGGFFKREGRPSEHEVLTSRFIDRPIRPLFPENFHYEIQVIATVLSAGPETEPDTLAMIGASAALMLSDAPFMGPIGGVRVARVNGELKCNPSLSETDISDIELIVAATRDAVVMVEGEANEVPEKDILAAIQFAHRAILPLLDVQEEFQKACGKPKIVLSNTPSDSSRMAEEICQKFGRDLEQALRIPEKQKRSHSVGQVKESVLAAFVAAEDEASKKALVESGFEELHYNAMRKMVLEERHRVDGRGYEDVRSISCEVGILPRAHGSALFTRGETQALVTTTLGTGEDEQIIDALLEEKTKRFMLHYNFPPFSVGEVKRLGSPGRREIGHGNLAERSLKRMIPSEESFPYTVRIVSEILESNGSSSMATVCGATLSLMDAGVRIQDPVAGIAMGLVKEGNRVAILSDILGDEDHLGDMDFKVAGTSKGVTALQMDIKIAGISEEILSQALDQARRGRLHILGKMIQAIALPKPELSPYAPRMTMIKIPKDMIGALIGTGGKNIRGIIEETGAKVDVEDDGSVKIFAINEEAMRKAVEKVEASTAVPELGKIYTGKVAKITDFGAFVTILPNTDGLLHISQIDYQRVNRVEDVLKEGDEVQVKVIRIEPSGKVALSRRDTMPAPEGWTPPPEGEGQRRDRGPRDRDRGGFRDRDRRASGGRDRRPSRF